MLIRCFSPSTEQYQVDRTAVAAGACRLPPKWGAVLSWGWALRTPRKSVRGSFSGQQLKSLSEVGILKRFPFVLVRHLRGLVWMRNLVLGTEFSSRHWTIIWERFCSLWSSRLTFPKKPYEKFFKGHRNVHLVNLLWETRQRKSSLAETVRRTPYEKHLTSSSQK